jgi:TonB family protein
MSPRSLLFSSDQETSQQLTRALREFGVHVAPCGEIFAALKTLTSHPFQMIVIDWAEGLEASFLLKTARELKTGHTVFAIVLGKAEANAALQEAGADLVLNRPLTVDGMKHALLNSRDFMTRLLAWGGNVPGFSAGSPATTGAASTGTTNPRVPSGTGPRIPVTLYSSSRYNEPISAGWAQTAEAAHPSEPVRTVEPPTFASLGDSAPRPSPATAFLKRAAMVVGFFALGYALSHPLIQGGALAEQVYGGNSREPQTLEQKDDSVAELSPEATLEPTQNPERKRRAFQGSSSVNIQVVPAHPLKREPLVTDPSLEDPQNETAEVILPEPTQPELLHAPVPVAEARKVPESIGRPFPGLATVHEVAAKAPGLVDALEPINLPDSLSEKLLISKIDPSYPLKALQVGLRGPVVLQAWIGKDGKIRDLKLIRGPLVLGQAAFEAVRNWRYRPYVRNGEAVEAQTLVTVDFKLP